MGTIRCAPRKGGRRDAAAIHPNVANRIRAYLEMAGHADDLEGPLFRPLSHNRKMQETRRRMDPDAIDRVLRKHCKAIGLDRGFSAHSMRATFITTALENGCSLEDVQRAAGHDQALRPARLQSGEIGELFRYVLTKPTGCVDRVYGHFAAEHASVLQFARDCLPPSPSRISVTITHGQCERI